MDRVMTASLQTGQHVLLYGERGVGKTSLARIIHELLKSAGLKTLDSGTVNCDASDDFSSLWHKLFRELTYKLQREGIGFQGEKISDEFSLDNLLPKSVTPDDIRIVLGRLNESVILVIDEIDRLKDPQARYLLADTIKTLSDHAVNCTLILVGVAESVTQLLEAHESIDRALVQIKMPRMSNHEIDGIISKGLGKCEMLIEPMARKTIIALSQGLPHYAHLIAFEAAMVTAMDRRLTITERDIDQALLGITRNKHSVCADYEHAVSSPQKTSIHPHVLVACALAEKEEDGFFSSSAIRKNLSEILGRECTIAAFARHLAEFCSEKRGNVLQRKGRERNFRYRFTNPLMEPYSVITGVMKGLINKEDVIEMMQLEFDFS